jgi:hypothetical protein
MSFSTYYSRLVSKVKQGGPTAQEARRDYQAMIAQQMRSL